MGRKRNTSTVLVLLVGSSVTLAAPRQYEVLDLRSRSNETRVTALNDRGQVAGSLYHNLGGFVTRSRSAIAPFRDLLEEARVVHDVNGSGMAVGGMAPDTAGVWFDGERRALTIDDLPAGNSSVTGFELTAINEDGLACGVVTGDLSGGRSFMGVVYDAREDRVWELDESERSGRVRATDINKVGSVVGYSEAGFREGLFWLNDVQYVLDGVGQATALNDLHFIVGVANDPFLDRPVYVDSVGTHWLPTLNSMVDSSPAAVNNSNLAVGMSAERATLWRLGHSSIVDLNDRIDPALGITLNRANDINDHGEIIATQLPRFMSELSGVFLLRPVPMRLEIEDLTAGDSAIARVYGCETGATVYVYYSLQPPGNSSPFWNLEHGVRFDLFAPRLRGVATANASGEATLVTRIDEEAAGRRVWIQAYHSGNKSDIVETIVQP
ncbi:MAG: hypothetical protein ACF8PN_12035 [Phycisphaerales bacterium]